VLVVEALIVATLEVGVRDGSDTPPAKPERNDFERLSRWAT